MQIDTQIVVAMIGGISVIVGGIVSLTMKLLFNGTGARVVRIENALDNHIVETRNNLKDVITAHEDMMETIHGVSERVAGLEARRST